MATSLPLSTIVNVSLATISLGANAYNTSNLACITGEPTLPATQTITFSATAASGAYTLTFGGNTTSSISWNATLATIQNDINAVTGMANVTVTGSLASGVLTLSQPGNLGPILTGTVGSNSLQTAGSVAITLTFATTNSGWSGGTAGYALYNSPTQVALDFGSSSRTYAIANSIFSQQPNILSGGGQFIAILRQVSQQTLTFSAVAASGAFEITYNANTSTSIAWNSSPAQIQAILQAVPGLGQCQVTGSITGAGVLTVILNGVYGVGHVLGTTANTLQTAGSASITITQATSVTGETYGAAITRTQGVVQYFGVMPDVSLAVIGQTDLLASAAVVQALNLLSFVVSYTTADIQAGGMCALVQSSSFTQTRCLFFSDSSKSGLNAVVYMAAYASCGLSVNFNGANTTTTQNLKTLSGVAADTGITPTILGYAQTVGADVYPSWQGTPGIYSTGANGFFDAVYNGQWYVGAIQVAVFNYLAQTATKIPQTESGMDGLKGACRNVSQQAVTNGYVAPGTWTLSTTFGNQQNFLNNISQYGYYIYSIPISQQTQTARTARQAPLVQIALKAAGAIQSVDIIVYINQ